LIIFLSSDYLVGKHHQVSVVYILEDYEHQESAKQLLIKIELDGFNPEPILESIIQVGVHREEIGDDLHEAVVVALHYPPGQAPDYVHEVRVPKYVAIAECGLLALPDHHHDPLGLLVLVVHHLLEVVLGDYLDEVPPVEILGHDYLLIVLLVLYLLRV
jgi:hypothetical protein